jgi:uncharacterized surface protein with fasciclin (FAS1) repeats
MDNIIDTAIKAGNFNTLVTAIKEAKLVETLSGNVPFTVFAPTDEAFAELPAGTVEALLKDIPKLVNILTYHVLEGKVLSDGLVNITSAKTIQGQNIDIDTENGVKINQAQVTTPDILASNGVIHVINSVILPK